MLLLVQLQRLSSKLVYTALFLYYIYQIYIVLRRGMWYVVFRIEASMSLEDVQHNDDIRPWVLSDLLYKSWPGFD